MDAVQHYFSYTMCCGCGFPSITLTGTPADWRKIRRKAEQLQKYGLDWWLRALLPALDQFVAASEGKPNLDFWMSLCHTHTGHSFDVYEPLTGWVQVFFPYLIKPGQGGWRSPDRFKGECWRWVVWWAGDGENGCMWCMRCMCSVGGMAQVCAHSRRFVGNASEHDSITANH